LQNQVTKFRLQSDSIQMQVWDPDNHFQPKSLLQHPHRYNKLLKSRVWSQNQFSKFNCSADYCGRKPRLGYKKTIFQRKGLLLQYPHRNKFIEKSCLYAKSIFKNLHCEMISIKIPGLRSRNHFHKKVYFNTHTVTTNLLKKSCLIAKSISKFDCRAITMVENRVWNRRNHFQRKGLLQYPHRWN